MSGDGAKRPTAAEALPRGEERFLVTGALGCIGAWTLRALADEGVPVVAFDRSDDLHRLRLVLEPEQLDRVVHVRGDITTLASIEGAIAEHGITHVIHLAALQVPFARADPPLGALVNVVGTVNVFEAVRRHRDQVRGLAYTSSVGMYATGDADARDGRLREDADAHPTTMYGVYKLANEGTARVYWLDHGLASVGLRPMTVYGPGRDQGLTSGPTRALLAALVGRPYRIGFGGRTLFQFAPDAARTIIAAARNATDGAAVYNLTGAAASVDEFVRAITDELPAAAGLIEHEDTPLPFPESIEAGAIASVANVPVTPLAQGIVRTIDTFRSRMAARALVPEEHGLEPLAAVG